MKCPPGRRRESRFAVEEKPRATTTIPRPSRQARRSSLTCGSTAASVVLPGQHQTRTGMPSRGTARPMMICGRSGGVLGVPVAPESGLHLFALALGVRSGCVLGVTLEVGAGGVEEQV